MRLGIGLVLGSGYLLVRSQSTHTVSVGQFYEPPLISALEGDVVQFLFTAGHHGITQAVGITNPCSQIEGGFNSGIVAGFVANDTNSSPVWSLTITNASAPLYFYCAATVPSFHCANGMVGAINAEPDLYTSYSLAAKSVTGTPVQTSSVVLSGIGAAATSPPFTPAASSLQTTSTTSTTPTSAIPLSTSSTASSSSSAIPSETSAPINKPSSNIGAAVGGGVGGAVGVCLIVILGALLCRSRRRRAASADASVEREAGEKYEPSEDPSSPPGLGWNDMHQGGAFSRGTPPPTSRHGRTMSSPSFLNMTGDQANVGGSNVKRRALNNSGTDPQSRSTTYTQASSGFFAPLSDPLSGGHSGQRIGVRTPDNSNTHFHPQAQYVPGVQGSNVNVQEIAKEVAALLGPQLRNANGPTPVTPPPGIFRALPNPHALKSIPGDQPPSSPAPPQYAQYIGN